MIYLCLGFIFGICAGYFLGAKEDKIPTIRRSVFISGTPSRKKREYGRLYWSNRNGGKNGKRS